MARKKADFDVEQLADLFRLMGDTSRLRIILTCMKAATNVGDIAKQLGLTPSLVSHHLRLLKAARILKGERQGKQVFYSACDQHVEHAVMNMAAHARESVSNR